ncbi:MAG: hypothetical protein FWB72_01050 [Firmicutes bacterium]|nr:hypothetical protein [Bacillota bacterium]
MKIMFTRVFSFGTLDRYKVTLLLLILVSAIFTLTIFSHAPMRLVEGFFELWGGLVSYVKFFFGYLPESSPLVPPSQSATPDSEISLLPDSPESFWQTLSAFFNLLFCKQNLSNFATSLAIVIEYFARVFMLAIPAYVLAKVLFKRHFKRSNNNYGKDSVALRLFNYVCHTTYAPSKSFVVGVVNCLNTTRFGRRAKLLLVLIWLLNFNFLGIGLTALGFLLYFFVSLDFASIYHFVLKLTLDILPAIRFMYSPLTIPISVLLVLYFIDKWRKKRAISVLNHLDNMNTGLSKSLPIILFFKGTVGTGKTTSAVDFALTEEKIQRTNALNDMLDIDLKFPNFSWILLENKLKEAIDRGIVFNLATTREFIDSNEKNILALNGIGGKENSVYDDKLKLTSLLEAVRDYAMLYLIYITQSSLILSNVAIRTDFVMRDNGNLPLWDLNFFTRDSSQLDKFSRHSKILDFNMLRLGKKILTHNQQAKALEFGVIVVDEVGKERGNQIDDRGLFQAYKKAIAKGEEAPVSPLTDGFNDRIKMIRHPAYVYGREYIRVIFADQRAESSNADLRQLATLVNIREVSEKRLAMPLFAFAELIYAWIFPRFKRLYLQYRFHRGDNTLLMALLKKAAATIHKHYTRIYNMFSYSVVILEFECGMANSSGGSSGSKRVSGTTQRRWYRITKKIYSQRFVSDAFGDFLREKQANAQIGHDQLQEYQSHRATPQEFREQNSHLIIKWDKD